MSSSTRARPPSAPLAAGRPIAAHQALRLLIDHLERRPFLIVSDFDGTLSPIVLDPWAAAILPVARRALRRLAGRAGVHVVILSGRTAQDVAGRVRVGGARYLGNHGLERGKLARNARTGRLELEPSSDQQMYFEAAERLAVGVAEAIPEPWLVVERKGPAVAFHYRSAPDILRAAAAVAGAVEKLDPEERLVRYPGRRVLELRPPGATAKGDAMAALLDELEPAVAVALGDDRSDAEAFTILRRARDQGRMAGLALAVQAHAEAPPEVAAAADGVLPSPIEAARFLTGLARLLV
ncbi:MAG: trehalose-phosphatase [Chloroflexi bacterium]|nr:trehalose-phosphatase [Chloroflexota bacterium]